MTRWYSVSYKQELDEYFRILKDMVSYLKNSFREQIQNSVYLSADSKRSIISKLDSIKGVHGFPEKFLDDQFLEAYYRAFTLYDSDDEHESFGITSTFNIRIWLCLRQFHVTPVTDAHTHILSRYICLN